MHTLYVLVQRCTTCGCTGG